MPFKIDINTVWPVVIPDASAVPPQDGVMTADQVAILEALASGVALQPKEQVRALGDANITLNGPQAVGGVACVAGDRVLLTAQANPIENGIWIVDAAAWTRAADLPDGSNASGAYCFVDQGTYAEQGWVCSTDRPNDLVGTDPLTFVKFSTFPLATTPPANVDKSAAQIGVSSEAARADHKHDVSTGMPGAINIGDAPDEGVSNDLARADHTHAFAAPNNPVDVTKAPADAGVSLTVAREDHKHDVATGVPVGFGTANAEGTGVTLARADHVHASVLPVLSNGTRPAANTVAIGTLIFNTSDNAPNVSDGTNWRDMDGNIT